MGNNLPKDDDLISLDVKHVSLGAIPVYEEHGLLEDKLKPFEIAKKLSDEEVFEAIWEVTFKGDPPADLKNMQMRPVVKGVFDFLDEFGRLLEE